VFAVDIELLGRNRIIPKGVREENGWPRPANHREV
jgi:hypothetical protein